MSLVPSLQNPNDLLLKLCRESINVYESKKDVEVLDRFFNFCITSHSLRDWIIKFSGLDKDTIHNYCNKFHTLEMCRDIANANKHFGLDMGRKSKVDAIYEKNISYYPLGPGGIDQNGVITKPSLIIIDNIGNKINLKDFMNSTVEAWVDVFDNFGITRADKLRYTRSFEVLYGDCVFTLF